MDKKIRIMPYLDMQNGRVVKGVPFMGIRDAGIISNEHKRTVKLVQTNWHF
jgi:imidazole glycerol phosphate synthase subunit HisF